MLCFNISFLFPSLISFFLFQSLNIIIYSIISTSFHLILTTIFYLIPHTSLSTNYKVFHIPLTESQKYYSHSLYSSDYYFSKFHFILLLDFYLIRFYSNSQILCWVNFEYLPEFSFYLEQSYLNFKVFL